MRSSERAAVALSIGYVLGRRKKLRMAAILAAATAVGGQPIAGMAMKRAMKMLGSTDLIGKLPPQLGDITDTLRGDLLPAGKAAAGAAVSNRIDSVTSSLHNRAERLRNPAETVAAGTEGAKDTAGRATSSAGRATSSAGRAASSAGRATSSAGRAATEGAGGRRLGRRRAAAEPEDELDERDARDEEEYETDDLERGEADEYEETPAAEDDEEVEPDDYDTGEPDDDEEGGVDEPEAPRRGVARRRSAVSRARR